MRSNGVDLLSTVVHEIGHVLGLSGFEPGEYNIYPHHVGGLQDVLVLEGGGGHLSGHGTVPFLMCEGCGVVGVRRFATATDVLVIAEDQGITDVHLERVGSISSGILGRSKQVDRQRRAEYDPGRLHPPRRDDHAQRGSARLAICGIAAGTTSPSQTYHLTVDGVVELSTAAPLSVGFGGTIAADQRLRSAIPALIDNDTGSLVQFNRFHAGIVGNDDRPASTAASRLGTTPCLRSRRAMAPTFDPSSISTWNIAEQLAIGERNTVSTLAINGGADFTSATGRIGADFRRRRRSRQRPISGTGSSWTIGGALDATKGSLNVVDGALLTTGSVTLGGNSGQMNAAVINASGMSAGSVDVGPPTLTGFGFGQAHDPERRRREYHGQPRDVHGTSSRLSEVTVTSAGRLDVGGDVIVRPYGRVTYGANHDGD